MSADSILSRATELNPAFLEPEYPFEWAGAYPLPAGTHELVIGHGDDDDHDHEHDHARACTMVRATHEHHHHHGNPNELDVVVVPVKSLEETDTASRLVKRRCSPFPIGKTGSKRAMSSQPGATLHRLLLKEGTRSFPLKITDAGHLSGLSKAAAKHPLHIQVNGETVKPVWQQDFHAQHSHEDAVTSVGISTAW